MASRSLTRDLRALRRLVSQADAVLATIPNPHPSIAASRESLRAATKLADYLASVKPAAVLGQQGGSTTAKKYGSEHFRELAAKRKTHAGGRPRKSD